MGAVPDINMRLSFIRGKDGIILTMRTNETIQGFVKNLGSGAEEAIENHGSKWLNLPGDPPLKVYNADPAILQEMQQQNNRYRLDIPGRALVISPEYQGYQDTLNLSFLRIVGAENGVRFLLKNYVASTDYLIDLRSRLVNSCRSVYQDYIRPCELEGVIMRTTLNDTLL